MHCVAAHRYGINIEDKKTPFEVLYFPPKIEAHNYKNSRKINFNDIEYLLLDLIICLSILFFFFTLLRNLPVAYIPIS